MLSVRSLGCRVGEKKLLNSVDLQLAAGEVCAVLGPNGAGKSTLLRTLAGTQSLAYQGSVTLAGKPVHEWDAGSLARHRGVLGQQVEVAWGYSVGQVVGLACWAHSRSEQESAMSAARELWGLEDLWQRSVQQLSGGEKQRVHLARVTAQIWPVLQKKEPVLLLLDEPISHLDPRAQVEILAQLHALADQGAAMVCVLHDVNLASRFADQCLLLRSGTVHAAGSCVDTITQANISTLYDVPVTRFTAADGLSWFVPEFPVRAAQVVSQ